MKRRILPVAVAGASALALLMAGCSDAPATTAPEGDSGATSILFVNPLPNYPAWRFIGDCMADQAEKRGVELTESGPTGQGIDATAMIEQVQQGIANDKTAIITFPASDAFGPVLEQAQASGILTATVYGSGADDSGADINIGVNFKDLGGLFVEAVSTIPGDKKIGLIAAGDTGLGGDWIAGVKAAVAEGENMEIVGEVYTGDDASKALDQTNALLTAHPEVNVIITHMGTVTQGAVTAIESRGLTGEVQFIGNGPDNGGKEALANGGAYRILMQGVCGAGASAVDAVVDRLESGVPSGEGELEFVQVGTKMVTTDEVDDLLAEGWQ